MKHLKLNDEALAKVNSQPEAMKSRLGLFLGVHPATIGRWIKDNHYMLTLPLTLKWLSNEIGMNPKEMLNDVKLIRK